jgi:hypothetical protein
VLCCALLCCALLCCALLCCVVLCYTVLCFAVLCCALLCFAVLCCVVLRFALISPQNLKLQSLATPLRFRQIVLPNPLIWGVWGEISHQAISGPYRPHFVALFGHQWL